MSATSTAERQGDLVLQAIQAKIDRYRTVFGRARHGNITWAVDDQGHVKVQLKPTF